MATPAVLFTPCSAQTECSTPSTLIRRELSDTSIPHLSQAAGANPPSAPFLPPDSSKTTALCRKRWIFHKGKQTSHSCTASPWSSLLIFRLTTTEKALQGAFLPYQRNSELVHSMPGWKKNHQALVGAQLPSQLCRHWLTRAFRLLWVTFLNFKQRAARCKALEVTTIHLWGCTPTFTVLSDVHWQNLGFLHWSHHFLGTDTYSSLPQLRA